MPSILIIDDDRDICTMLTNFLTRNDYIAHIAHTGHEGLQQLRSNEYDLVLCDYKLPDVKGVELLQKIKILNTNVAVIIITGYADVKSAVETFRFGANDYITKPLYPDELLLSIKEVIAKNQLKLYSYVENNEGLSKRVKVQHSIASTANFIVGRSAQSIAVQQNIELVAPSDISVIISGETGTGKEFVAQSIHKFSKRCNKPFMAIDCGALPKELAGSELFGHLKGSFTGAIADKQGSFEIADGGTLFLDEISNLSYENQIKLLRVIQERKIRRIGSNKDMSIDVRIIAATNETLLTVVKEGRLREDLYHRLNEFTIKLTPLRERQDDILYFAEFFLNKANVSLEKNVKSISPEVQHILMHYFWHGNLRELNNVIRRAVLLTAGDVILPESLPHEIVEINSTQINGAAVHDNVGLLKSIAWTAERQAILDALERVKHNKSKAANLLNIDRKTLYNKLKLYNIET